MTYNLTTTQAVALSIALVWELVWKAIALWRAARRQEPYWFAALLVINTVGVFSIAYLLVTGQNRREAT